MNNNVVVITYYKKKILCLYIEAGVPKELKLFDDEELGIRNVYVGKVKNIVKNIGAAFVEIAPKQNCFFKLEDLDKLHVLNRERKEADLKQGDEVLVQIVKGAVKDKAPVCTGKIKLPKEELNRGLEIAPTRTVHSVLYSAKPGYLTFLKDIDLKSTDRIVCVDDTIYQDVDSYVESLGFKPESGDKSSKTGGMGAALTEEEVKNIRGNIAIYTDAEYPVNKLYKIDSIIAELTCHKLWLKSGANIVIDYTEAMTVIDVNSAKSIADKHPDHILRVNTEAADEVFRQIRLRNLSGMILIDFINDSKEGTAALTEHVQKLCAQDIVECRFIDVTGLNIFEFTRKKLGRPIYELL
jgi:ribonuclease G